MVLSFLTYHPVIEGLAFMEKEPPVLYCLSEANEWEVCTKEHVCSSNLTRDEWKADSTQYEYLDNWVEKFNLLCKPHYEVGFFGASYFFGVITTIVVVPALGDAHGRRKVFLATLCTSIVA